MAAIICFGVSCKSKDNGKTDEPTPEQETVYLTADQFMSSSWKGTQSIGTTATLAVASGTITVSYYVKQTLAKNTDEKLEQKVVKISPYNYDEKSGKFSGTGNDNFSYQGQVTSATQLSVTLATSETVKMNKQ